jgi:hypothetical protein
MLDWLRSYRHPLKEVELSAYLDDRLPPDRSRRLEEHLRSCDPCRRRLADLRALAEALREMPEAPVPRSFALTPEQVRVVRPARPYAPVGRLYPVFRNAAAAALVLLFALVGADIFLQSSGGRGEPQGTAMSAEKNAEMPSVESGAAADEEKSEREAFGQGEATPHDVTGSSVPPVPAVPGVPPTPLPEAALAPLPTLSPVVPETPLPGAGLTPLPGLALAAPGTPPAPEAAPPAAAPEKEEEDRVWLRALEGIIAGLALGFLAVALFVRVRSRRAGTPT